MITGTNPFKFIIPPPFLFKQMTLPKAYKNSQINMQRKDSTTVLGMSIEIHITGDFGGSPGGGADHQRD